jgi:hypothetical protein
MKEIDSILASCEVIGDRYHSLGMKLANHFSSSGFPLGYDWSWQSNEVEQEKGGMQYLLGDKYVGVDDDWVSWAYWLVCSFRGVPRRVIPEDC